MQNEAAPKIFASNSAVSRFIDWIVIFFFTLFAWNQSIFQFNLYWTTQPIEYFLLLLTAIAAVVGMMIGFVSKLSHHLINDFFLYLIVCLLFAVIGQFRNEGKLLFYIEAMSFSVAMLWIIRDERLLYRFVILNFWMGFILILLNSVTILHWLKIIDLPYEQVVRIGGNRNLGQAHLDPYYFGIFGLTENHIHPNSMNKITARLQGWASEPLHWSYFVFLTLSYACLLLHIRGRKNWIFMFIAVVFICVHLYFIQSTTATLSVFAIFLSTMSYWFLKRIKYKKESLIKIMFFIVVLFPGLIIPFILDIIPNVQNYFFHEHFFGEGRNWEGKLVFLDMGKYLFFRIFPTTGLIDTPSHNLVLEKYIQGGLFFLMPLLYFLYRFLKTVINEGSFWLATAAITFIIAHTLTVPEHFFHPTAPMWFLTILATAFYKAEIRL